MCCLVGDTIVTIKRENGDIESLTLSEVVELINQSERLMVLSENKTFSLISAGMLTRKEAEILEIIDEETNYSIKCTPNHLIFTKNRGYVRADELVETDELELYV